jgi:hypothetical protein
MGRIKSAVQMRQRPTAALLEETDPFTNWNSLDYRLQEAFTALDNEICKTCGNPVWFCHSADNRIDFEIRTGACYAKAEIDDFEENNSNPKLEAGEYHYAVPVGIKNEDGTFDPLPSRREAMEKLV